MTSSRHRSGRVRMRRDRLGVGDLDDGGTGRRLLDQAAQAVENSTPQVADNPLVEALNHVRSEKFLALVGGQQLVYQDGANFFDTITITSGKSLLFTNPVNLPDTAHSSPHSLYYGQHETAFRSSDFATLETVARVAY